MAKQFIIGRTFFGKKGEAVDFIKKMNKRYLALNKRNGVGAYPIFNQKDQEFLKSLFLFHPESEDKLALAGQTVDKFKVIYRIDSPTSYGFGLFNVQRKEYIAFSWHPCIEVACGNLVVINHEAQIERAARLAIDPDLKAWATLNPSPANMNDPTIDHVNMPFSVFLREFRKAFQEHDFKTKKVDLPVGAYVFESQQLIDDLRDWHRRVYIQSNNLQWLTRSANSSKGTK